MEGRKEKNRNEKRREGRQRGREERRKEGRKEGRKDGRKEVRKVENYWIMFVPWPQFAAPLLTFFNSLGAHHVSLR